MLACFHVAPPSVGATRALCGSIAYSFLTETPSVRATTLYVINKNEYSFFIPKLSDADLDARRAHILRAAELCFARNGFHQTTIADVRKQAGVSTGAIYTYFRNKEAMMRAILENARDERRLELETATTSDSAFDVGVVLLEWASRIFESEGLHRARVDVNLWAEALRNPRVQRLAEGALSEATTAVTGVVAARLPTSGPARSLDPSAVASVLIAMFLGLEVQTAVGVGIERNELLRALGVLFADYVPRVSKPPRGTGNRRPRPIKKRT